MTVGAYFRSLTVLHAALLAGQLLFACILFVVVRQQVRRMVVALPVNPWLYVALGVTFAVLAAAHFVYRSRVDRAREKETLADQLTAYRTAFAGRDMALNSLSTVGNILFFLCGNTDYIAITGMAVLIFAVWWPTKAKVKDVLGLEGLDNPDALIGGS
ncbi:hypothetical protein EDB95_2687 [Dinghuibacter silviterrae]|uniref:Uncharacterized protein n=2 Tax=Dinghuibacter silviterrae TaxID=1539049 RepID=A0A4R8DUM8_9BACT|nr:hypothetical protein EDB95_2687 [Dinghuibacter silviterrae]